MKQLPRRRARCHTCTLPTGTLPTKMTLTMPAHEGKDEEVVASPSRGQPGDVPAADAPAGAPDRPTDEQILSGMNRIRHDHFGGQAA
jgi:hypothetical protein